MDKLSKKFVDINKALYGIKSHKEVLEGMQEYNKFLKKDSKKKSLPKEYQNKVALYHNYLDNLKEKQKELKRSTKKS